jgi:hypothetical protein
MRQTQAPFARQEVQQVRSVPCSHRRGTGLSGRKRTVVDDSGSLAITAWTCVQCGELIEEIRMLSRDGGLESRSIRYAVGPWSR